jgi:ankyrin repeat protein
VGVCVCDACVRAQHHRFEVKKADGDGNTPLHIAAIVTNHPGAKLLLASGCDVNARNHQGNTPLHLAVSDRLRCACVRVCA